MSVWKKSMICTSLAGGLLLGSVGLPAVAAPPTPVAYDFVYQCGEPGEGGARLRIVAEGKEKIISNPAGIKSISPGLKATVTNVDDPTKTVSATITGTLRFEPQGTDTRVRATGRNLLIRSGGQGLVLTSGNVTFAVNSAGIEVDPPTGPGRATDLCVTLA